MPCTKVPGSAAKNAGREAIRQRLASLQQFSSQFSTLVDTLATTPATEGQPILRPDQAAAIRAIPDRLANTLDQTLENYTPRVEMLAAIDAIPAGGGGDEWYLKSWSGQRQVTLNSYSYETTHRYHLEITDNGDTYYTSVPALAAEKGRDRTTDYARPPYNFAIHLRYPSFLSGSFYTTNATLQYGAMTLPEYANPETITSDAAQWAVYIENWLESLNSHLTSMHVEFGRLFRLIINMALQLDYQDIMAANISQLTWTKDHYSVTQDGGVDDGHWTPAS